jgi:hypothetical protein
MMQENDNQAPVEPAINANDGQVNQSNPENKPTSQENSLVFGKFKNMEEAHNGYKSAEKKIQEQGGYLNKMKEQLDSFKPMEDYEAETWNQNIDKWIEEKILPEGVNLDQSIPEVNMLISGFKKAGISEKQAKEIISGAVERQVAMVNEKKEAITKELGEEGMRKVDDLNRLGSKFSKEDAVVFESLFAFPYVEAAQVDLMHRLLCNNKEQNIPMAADEYTGKSSEDMQNDIIKFQKENERDLHNRPDLQKKEADMWLEYNRLKSRGV